MTPATQQETVDLILELLNEDDGMTESEQQIYDIACDVHAGYAAASSVDESETIDPN